MTAPLAASQPPASTLPESPKSSSKIEVEIKFRIADAASLHTRLLALGFQLLTPSTWEYNRLFDNAERTLRAVGETLRIRRYGDTYTLTHKTRLAGASDATEREAPHKHRLETETTLADGEALVQVFARLGYHVTFVYEKWRAEYSDGAGHLVLDETPIGTFAELEGPSEWIDATAAHLGVAPSDYMTASYARLFIEWKNTTGNTAENMTREEIEAGASR